MSDNVSVTAVVVRKASEWRVRDGCVQAISELEKRFPNSVTWQTRSIDADSGT